MIGASDFTSYAIGELLQRLTAAGAAEPKAPAFQLLRRVTVATLPWDHYFKDAWSDPTFQPRYEYLRGRLLPDVAHDTPLKATPALANLAELLTEIEKIEEPF